MRINKEDIHTFFSKPVQELLLFENTGITVSTPNGPRKIYFSVAAFIGDNLAVHSVLGFTLGFTANFPCHMAVYGGWRDSGEGDGV